MLNGALSGAAIALSLAGWLLVRHRPLPAFAVVLLPAATAYVLGQVFPQYGGRAVVGAVLGTSVVAGAWLARSLAASRFTGRARSFQRQPRIPPVK